MQIKIKKIVEDRENLELLATEKLPVKVSYWIKRISDKVVTELATYEKQRLELIKELGEKIKDKEGVETEQMTVTKENLPKFFEEIEKLQDIEINIDVEPISISELSGITIEPNKLVSWIFYD
jgi:hypothetical protein